MMSDGLDIYSILGSVVESGKARLSVDAGGRQIGDIVRLDYPCEQGRSGAGYGVSCGAYAGADRRG